jgi:threonine/homoserine/homoserine lactone efflux protein
MTFVDWLTIAPIMMLLSLGPGPNNFMAMSNGINQGPMAALIGTIGRNFAFSILMFISALGLGAVIVSSSLLFNIVKWAGVLYLLYMGIKTWRNAAQDVDTKTATSGRRVAYTALIRQEFLVAIGNPKAVLVFTAVFPQLLNLEKPVMIQFLVMGLTFIVTEFIASYIYAVAGKQIKRLIKSSKGVVRLNRSMGAIFVAASAVLASASR